VALALDDLDNVVGFCTDTSTMASQSPCLWPQAGAPVDVTPAGDGGGQAVAINRKGWVVVNASKAWVVYGAMNAPPHLAVELRTEWDQPLVPSASMLDDPGAAQAVGMGLEFVPMDPTPRFDSVVGVHVCQSGDGLVRPTSAAVHWTSARNTISTQVQPSFLVEDLNSVIAGDVPAYLDFALATNAKGRILATGYPVGRGQPFPSPLPPHHLYLLEPIMGPTPPDPITPPTVSPGAVVGSFSNFYGTSFSGALGVELHTMYPSCPVQILPDGQMEMCGGVWGSIDVTGKFSVSDGSLSISGTLKPDPKNNVVGPTIPTLLYSWNDGVSSDAGMLTLQ
jgi:hypothetical protein